ncbi:hypothetical protein MUO14_03620 [Halobacillus shinanisalinarum]|uniref:Histidine kinase domain-containing protein n=1 Tax=Halobacillus shinanisalinarum TaxID=2932258 RepID=A0ABY4H1K7_9BACI|nr:ATP-binding protein [Halobacillus shinanisalinarum]UOQ94071.1 hypothetical protein MUO14_03620 [Halobacillus shinanisalinarum]
MRVLSWKQTLLVLFIILSACYITMISVTQPFIGIELEQNRNNEWIITQVKGDSWADEKMIPIGAELTSVEGSIPDEHYTVRMFQELENAKVFTVENAGEKVTYSSINESTFLHWTLFIILPLLFLCATFWISKIVQSKVAKRFSANQLMLFFLLIALGYLSNSGAVRDDLYSIFLNSILFLLSPVVLIHFLYNYFSELRVHWFSKKIYQILYILVTLVTVAESYFLITVRYPAFFYPVPGTMLLMLYIVLFFIIFKGLSIYKDTSVGTVFKYIGVGMSVAFFPYIFLYLTPALTIHAKIIPLEIAALFLIALPVTFMYLVTRERLIDIHFVIGRLRYYALISALPGVLIPIIISMIVEKDLTMIEHLQVYLTTHFLLIILLSIKEILDFRLQKFLFVARYSYQESMHRISKEMKDQSNAVDLMKVMRKEIGNVLKVRDMYIYSIHNERKMYCVYDPIPADILCHFDDYFPNRHYDVGTILETDKGFGVIVGFTLDKITMLWCRGKKDYTSLNRDEKTYLQTIAQNANIAIENMNLIADLVKELRTLRSDQTHKYPTWLSRLLFTIAENQRKQLSIDLHDTVLQEQLYLYRRMDDLMNKRADLPKTLDAELSMYKESLLDNIHLIRETCNELRPAFIEEIGLVHSLETLIEQYQLRSNFTVYFTSEGFNAKLDQEHVLAIFRIIQELLTNAMKHSNAKIVKLSLSNNHHQVILLYSDDGKGMDYSFQRDLFSHIGLSGIEQRVNGLNGYLKIETALDEGFKSIITFPNKATKEVEV